MKLAATVLAFAALLTLPLRAADPPRLDPESNTPYSLQVVLHTRPHPLLGPSFRADVKREILAAMQPVLGGMGTVEVLDLANLPREQWPALAKEYDARGWPALDMSHLRELTGVKTQIVHVEVRGQEYHLETRQLDGFTGLPLPIARRQTRSPELVGRIAGLLIDRDFGIDGTIEFPVKPGDEVTVRVRGAGLGPLDRFVKAGDVFAVAGVRKSARPPGPPPARTATGRLAEKPKEQPPGLTSVARDYTLLRAIDGQPDGTLRCKVYTGSTVALPLGNGILGYRCVKLPTVTAPVSLRLVGRPGGIQKLSTATVRATDIAWDAPARELELRDSVFRSDRNIDRLALVTLAVGQSRTAQVPIPVYGGEPITIPFNLDPADERRVLFERECTDLVRRVAEARITQASVFEALSKLIDARKNKDALARAVIGMAVTQSDEKELGDTLTRLRSQAVLSTQAASLLDACERQLTDIRAAHAELTKRTKELENIVARENDPGQAAQEVQAESLNTRIRLLLERGEVDEALTIYDQLVTLLPDQPEIAQRRNKLREEWKPKSDAHARAREYLTKSWPALATIPDLRESLKPLDEAVDECIRNGDTYTFHRLVAAVAALPVKVNDLVQNLDGANETDRMTLTDAQRILEVVNAIDTKVRASLKKGS